MLKRQEGYILKYIDDKTYLLPYGQKIADLRKGIQLNDTGAFIWNVLEQPQDIHALQDLLIAHYTPEADIEMQLREDVSQFVEQLLQLGILREELLQTVCSDMDIEIILGEPQNHQNGTILLRNKELIVSCWEEGYLLQFPTLDNIIEAQITTNANYARISLSPI